MGATFGLDASIGISGFAKPQNFDITQYAGPGFQYNVSGLGFTLSHSSDATKEHKTADFHQIGVGTGVGVKMIGSFSAGPTDTRTFKIPPSRPYGAWMP